MVSNRSLWSDETLPDPELPPELSELRLATTERFIDPRFLEGEEGPDEEEMSMMREWAEEAGGDPSGTFLMVLLLPLEPDIAERTRIRPLFGLPR